MKVPVCWVNDLLPNTARQMIPMTEYLTLGYVNLHSIRNLYLVSNAAGTHDSMRINGEWRMLKKIPVSVGYNQLIYHQTV